MSKYIPAEHREFVDALREMLGLAPLYATDNPSEYRQQRSDWNDRSQYGLPAKPKRVPGGA